VQPRQGAALAGGPFRAGAGHARAQRSSAGGKALSAASQCDKLALHHGKRCILWDDDGSGFCLWLHWDWAANRPATVDPDDKRRRAAPPLFLGFPLWHARADA